jgi:hypothetical protein
MGCSLQRNATADIDDDILMAFFSVDVRDEAYLLHLKKPDLFEGVFGTRKNSYLEDNNFVVNIEQELNDDIFNNNFFENDTKNEVILTEEQRGKITKMSEGIADGEKLRIESLRKGSEWVVFVSINNETYSFYYSDRYKNEKLGDLVDKMLLYSPVKIEKNDRY